MHVSGLQFIKVQLDISQARSAGQSGQSTLALHLPGACTRGYVYCNIMNPPSFRTPSLPECAGMFCWNLVIPRGSMFFSENACCYWQPLSATLPVKRLFPIQAILTAYHGAVPHVLRRTP